MGPSVNVSLSSRSVWHGISAGRHHMYPNWRKPLNITPNRGRSEHGGERAFCCSHNIAQLENRTQFRCGHSPRWRLKAQGRCQRNRRKVIANKRRGVFGNMKCIVQYLNHRFEIPTPWRFLISSFADSKHSYSQEFLYSAQPMNEKINTSQLMRISSILKKRCITWQDKRA